MLFADSLAFLLNVSITLSSAVAMILAEGEAAAQPAATPLQRMLNSPMILIIGLLLIWYITMIAPERKRKIAEDRLMSALKKNDRVVTVGGIHGTIVSASPESKVVTLRIDENANTRIKVNRTAIATVIDPNKENKESSDKESK